MRRMYVKVVSAALAAVLPFAFTTMAFAAPVEGKVTGPERTAPERNDVTKVSFNGMQTARVETGFLDADDDNNWVDSYQFDLTQGQVLHCTLEIDGDPTEVDFDLLSWFDPTPLNATPDEEDDEYLVAKSWGYVYPEEMWVAADVGGTYNIDVEAFWGASNYTLTMNLVDKAPAAFKRIDGSDRFVVAAKAAAEAFGNYAGVTDVIIACGEDRAAADPLAAAGLAGAYNAPVLLTRSRLVNNRLPSSTESALAAIRNANGGKVNIHVVGGTTSVPPAVYNRISALKGTGGTIERINAADRYSLSAVMARRAKTVIESKGGSVPFVMIANGENPAAFFDALAASPISFYNVAPTMLTRRTSLPTPVANALNQAFPTSTTDRVVVNSVDYVSNAVAQQAGAVVDGFAFRMSSESDRYFSANEIYEFALAFRLIEPNRVAVAAKLPDALTGGVALGKMGGAILYTNGRSLDPYSAVTLYWGKGGFDQLYIIGGTASVSNTVRDGMVALTRY